jgi:hypothetical protein
MVFGIAELQDSGWTLRSEMTFSDRNEAIAIAQRWGNVRGSAVGVATMAEQPHLVWRSDGGALAFEYLGTQPPSSARLKTS